MAEFKGEESEWGRMVDQQLERRHKTSEERNLESLKLGPFHLEVGP